MSKPLSLIEDTRAFARDHARDRMPRGYLWDMADFVPSILDSQLTSRGGWAWGSTAIGVNIDGGIYAPFKTGDKLLLIGSNGWLYDVGLSAPFTATAIAGAQPVAQNPVMHRDWVFTTHRDGTQRPVVIQSTPGFTVQAMTDTTAPLARYCAVFKDRLVVGNIPGNEQQIRFSHPGFIQEGNPNTGNPVTMSWDANSFINTSHPVTGIAALRAMILVFHAGSVERIRGSIPPGTNLNSDMFLEDLFDRAGCTDARSIAFWNDNCIFADERGIHLTDGSIVRNLISQAGLMSFWRTLYRQKLTLAGETYLDYYVCTVRRTDGIAVTLICDLNRRSIFRFSNVNVTCYIPAIGAQEKLWGGHGTAQRLVELSPCFFPVFGLAANQDADGAAVMPSLETAWFRNGEEGRKRIRHAYLSYDIREPGGAVAMEWRAPLDPTALVTANPVEPRAVNTPMLAVEYITSPQDATYTASGSVTRTSKYTRKRMPVGKQPYGIAFRVRQLVPSSVTRVFDLGVEVDPKERSAL